METVRKKQEQEAIDATKSTIGIYMQLALLEKENKKESEEYKNLFGLLEWAIQNEQKKHMLTNFTSSKKPNFRYQLLSNQSDCSYFLSPNAHNLTAIRTLNHVDGEYIYALDGIIKSEGVSDLQDNINQIFLNEIELYLKRNPVTDLERATLIDFKYGMIATSETLEQKFIFGELEFPKTNFYMNEEEMQVSGYYATTKFSVLCNYITSLTDEEINEQTLPIVLYAKACIPVLPPIFIGGALTELNNCIHLSHFLEEISGKRRKKVREMIAYLIGDNCQKEKNKI